ncbi:hypothetical protein FF38_14239 [Lucilia cuprina]|uniref:Uncharacterized protein n=1 Tax=Lucilia cuprina TaxID=7375 RepID=A0A0L0BPR3_LUCCU|nr:hypothetical protein CVS40_1301 [Lucilia cuprina]KNC22047.1 hypothetical protein FF38_14239 [Lucilia cuprina]
MGVTSSGLDLEDAVVNGEDGYIKSTTAQIENENITFASGLFVETVSDGSSGRFIDDTQNIQTSNGTSILSGLTLRVIEIGWHSDDSICNWFAQVSFGGFLHFRQNHRRDFFGEESFLLILIANLDLWFTVNADNIEGPMFHISLNGGIIEFATNQTLSIEDGICGIHSDLIFGCISNKTFSVGEGNI